MKIYAQRENLNNLKNHDVDTVYKYLKRFEHKELWVKVGIGTDFNTFYIRILNVFTGIVIANMVDSFIIDDDDTLTVTEDITHLENIHNFPLSNIELLSQCDVISTDELIELLNDKLMTY